MNIFQTKKKNKYGETMKKEKEFYNTNAIELAKNLIGKTLVHKTNEGITKGIIVETEAYMGKIDDAAHSFKKSKKRTAIQYKDGGFVYMYLSYGIHYNFNITCNKENIPESVLIRALQPYEGIELMKKRRKTEDIYKLCNGPGNLSKAMGFTLKDYGKDLTKNEIYIEDNIKNPTIVQSKRIGISENKKSKDKLWRFYLKDNKFISK